MSDLAALPNLGAVSAGWLRAVGIESVEELERVGAVTAYLRVKEAFPRCTLNLLYALNGALVGVRWDLLPPSVRAELRAEAEAR